jgi:hypothetical protein
MRAQARDVAGRLRETLGVARIGTAAAHADRFEHCGGDVRR